MQTRYKSFRKVTLLRQFYYHMLSNSTIDNKKLKELESRLEPKVPSLRHKNYL